MSDAITEATAQRIATALERVIELLGRANVPSLNPGWLPASGICNACGMGNGQHRVYCVDDPLRIT